jgi:TP901 family phage tail tape measure protein
MAEVATLEVVYKADTTSFDRGTKAVENSLRGVADGATQMLADVGGQITSLGSSLVQVAGPVAAVFGVATGNALDFNKAMANAFSIIEVTGAEADRLYDIILDKGSDAVAGPQMVAEAYFDVVSGIQDATAHMDILDAAIATSEAGQANLQSTTNALIGVMNAYGLEASEAAHVSDIFTKTVQSGVLTMDELAAVLPRVTSLAAKSDISLEELAGSLAFMTKTGTTAAQAATQLQAAMIAVLKPNQNMTDALEELGVASGEALLSQFGLIDSLQMLSETSVVADVGLAATLGSTEALQAAMVLTGEATDTTTTALGVGAGAMVGYGAGASDAETDVDNLSDSLTGADGLLNSVTEIGQALDEVSTEFDEKFGDMMKPVEMFSDEVSENADKFGTDFALALNEINLAAQESNPFETLGKDFDDLMGPFQQFGPTADKFGDALGISDEKAEGLGDTLDTLISKDVNPLADWATEIDLIGTNASEAKGFVNEMSSEIDGATDRALDIQKLSPSDEFARMKSEFEATSIILGEQLLPALTDFGDIMIPMLETTGEWIEENPKLAKTIGMIAIAATALGAVLIPVGMAIAGLGTILGIVFSPIGLIILGIIAVLALLKLAYDTNFGGFADAVNDIVTAFEEGDIRGLITGIAQAIFAFPIGLVNALFGEDVGADFADNLDGIAESLGTLPDDIIEFGEALAGIESPDDLGEVFSTSNKLNQSLLDLRQNIANAILELAKIILPEPLEGLVTKVQELTDGLFEAQTEMTNFILESAEATVPDALTTINDILKDIDRSLGGIPGDLLAIGLININTPAGLQAISDIVSGIVGGLSTILGFDGEGTVGGSIEPTETGFAGGGVDFSVGGRFLPTEDGDDPLVFDTWDIPEDQDSGGRAGPGTYMIGTGAQPELFTTSSAGTFVPNADQLLKGGGGGNNVVINIANLNSKADDPKQLMNDLVKLARDRGGVRLAVTN